MRIFIIFFAFLSVVIFAFDNCPFRRKSQSTVLESNKTSTKDRSLDEALEEPKDKWVNVLKDFFSISMPITMKENKVTGIDSSIWSYSDEEISLDIESGDFTNNLEGLQKHPNYKEEWKDINGIKGKLISFNYEETYNNLKEIDKKNVVAVYFSQTDGAKSNITFWISFRDLSKKPIAINILESIKFKDAVR